MIINIDQAAALLGKSVSDFNEMRIKNGKNIEKKTYKAPVTNLFNGIKAKFDHIDWSSKSRRETDAIKRRLISFLADKNCEQVVVLPDDLPRTRSGLNDSAMSIDLEDEEQPTEKTTSQVPLSELFKKINRAGARFSYSIRLNLMIACLLSRGLSSYQVQAVFETLCSLFPELLPNDDGFKVPSSRHIRYVRSCFAGLNEYFFKKFLEKSTCLTMMTDGSPRLDGDKMNAYVFYDESGIWRAHSVQPSSGGTAVRINADMQKVMDSLGEHQFKLKYVVSDSCSSQLAANRLFMAKNDQVCELRCSMHTTKWLEAKCLDGFSQDPEACAEQDGRRTSMPTSYTGQILRFCQLLFGNRRKENSGVHTSSLKKQLSRFLETNDENQVTIKSSRGCRFSSDYQNSVTLLLNWDAIREVCRQHQSNSWAKSLFSLMDDGNAELFKSELCVLVLFWTKVINPYWQKSAKVMTPNELTELVADITAKFERILAADYDRHFDTLLSLEGTDSKRVSLVLDKIIAAKDSYQNEMTQDQRRDWQEVVRIDTVVRVCAEILLAKFK